MDIDGILARLSLEEKASLCSGCDSWHTRAIERLGVPPIMMADGPHGLRKEVSDSSNIALKESYPATCFPTASALACTWNRALIEQVGSAIAEECLAEQVSVVLGPGVNIKRSPLCGRNFEYYSEDPFLTGELAAAFVTGVQQNGVGTSLKHFAVNNQEYRRMVIDAVVDERALREIYLPGFEHAIKKAQPWTVMAAYNRVNGTYCTENERLIGHILRKEWGFNGIVVSDWGAVNDRVEALQAGLDLEMPGISDGNTQRILQAVIDGKLSENTLDAAVRRILEFIGLCQSHIKPDHKADLDANHQLARKAAGEAAVLLKNEGPILPLDKDMKIALIGQFAKSPRYQGSGSSFIHPSKMDTLYEEMLKAAGPDHICYADGYVSSDNEVREELIAEAVCAAGEADAVVLCTGLTDMDEIEGIDRAHLRLPESHDQLIRAVAAMNKNTVVLLSNGAPVEMPWIENVPAVLEGYLGGQAGAGAHCDILYGQTNPSGKLAETFPISLDDVPSNAHFPGGPKIVEYRESLYVGYRFYDSVKKAVLFPFGHGLSYTTFDYSDLKMAGQRINADDGLAISFIVKNNGNRAGKEIVQVYVRDVQSTVFRPVKELKGFEKVDLESGEEKMVTIELDRRAFSFYSCGKKDWIVESGEFEILVGASSRDIRLREKVTVVGEEQPGIPAGEDYREFPANARVSTAEFESILGRKVPENPSDDRPYTLNTTVGDMQGSLVGRILYRVIRKQINMSLSADLPRPTRLMVEQAALEGPLRLLLMYSRGALKENTMAGLLLLANGRIWKGIAALLRSSQTPVVKGNDR